MDTIQKRYAMQRVKEIKERQLNALRAKYTKPAKELSEAKMVTMIRQGKVRLRSSADLSTALEDAYDFSAVTRPEVLDKEAYDREAAKVVRAASEVSDAIMLGNDTEAHNRVRQFCMQYGSPS